MIEEFDRKTTCSFTGHRVFSWGRNELDPRCETTKIAVADAVKKACKMGYKTFLNGMALGADMMCAEIVLALKKKYKDIQLVCVLPCNDQEKRWNEGDKNRYKYILSKADTIVTLADSYFNGCMQVRDKYLVDNASRLIAIFTGKKGGTSLTVGLGVKAGIDIEIINPENL